MVEDVEGRVSRGGDVAASLTESFWNPVSVARLAAVSVVSAPVFVRLYALVQTHLPIGTIGPGTCLVIKIIIVYH